MKCNGCGTAMTLDRCEGNDHVSSCWLHCPLCGKVRLTSQVNHPLTATPHSPGQPSLRSEERRAFEPTSLLSAAHQRDRELA